MPGKTQGRSHRALGGEAKPVAAQFAGAHGAASTVPADWRPPAASARGPEWTYDVFTPPEIVYDAEKQQFSVARSRGAEEASTVEREIPLSRAVRMPFRLQLIGYVGGEGRFLGTFENQLTGEVFLAQGGREVAELGLEIADFAVTRQPVVRADSLTSNQLIATAVVLDDTDGTETTLRLGERSYIPDGSAHSVVDAEDEDAGSTPP
jgi:hypothetical protein